MNGGGQAVASLSEVRSALQTRLATISGLRAYSTWPDQVHAPAALVRPVSMRFSETMDDRHTMMFEVILLAAPVGDGLARAQDKLDPYLDESGTSSVRAAIEADVQLGGKAEYVTVTGWRQYASMEVGGVEFLGAIFDVAVLVS